MRGYLLALAVIVLAGLLRRESARPGDAPYTPTKLEWAALESANRIRSRFWPGKNFSMSFRPENDGRSVHCLLDLRSHCLRCAVKGSARPDADACCGFCEKQSMGLARRDLQRRSHTLELASFVRPFSKASAFSGPGTSPRFPRVPIQLSMECRNLPAAFTARPVLLRIPIASRADFHHTGILPSYASGIDQAQLAVVAELCVEALLYDRRR